MKAIFILLLALGIGAFIGLGLHHDPGMIVITVANWRVDMPLWLALLLGVIFVFIASLIFKGVKSVFNISTIVSDYLARRHQLQARLNTHHGLIALTEGHWQKAEKLLIKGVRYNECPWMNYLLAANAAQQENHIKKRDDYLIKAHELLPEGEIAVGLARAQLQFQHKEYVQSLETLKSLQHKSPKHPFINKLLLQIYAQNENWNAALALISECDMQVLFSAEESKSIALRVYKGVFAQNQKADLETISKIWQKIPKEYKLDADIASLYAHYLLKKHYPKEALEVIRLALRNAWDEGLIILYGRSSHPQPEKLLTQAESWLDSHPQSPGLLLTLGRLCEQLQLWGKAQRYYEASLALKPSPETYYALGALLESMNEAKLGAQYYKKGLMLFAGAQV